MSLNFEAVCPKLDLELNLPNHSNELSKAEFMISRVSDKIKKVTAYEKNSSSHEDAIAKSKLNDKNFVDLFEEVARALVYVGRLSQSIFELEDTIEQAYTIKYIHYPEEVKSAWYKHYSELHNPYTILKNRCYALLTDLDEEYLKKFKKEPPNFKI